MCVVLFFVFFVRARRAGNRPWYACRFVLRVPCRQIPSRSVPLLGDTYRIHSLTLSTYKRRSCPNEIRTHFTTLSALLWITTARYERLDHRTRHRILHVGDYVSKCGVKGARCQLSVSTARQPQQHETNTKTKAFMKEPDKHSNLQPTTLVAGAPQLIEQWKRKGVRPEVSTRRQPTHRDSYSYTSHVRKVDKSRTPTKSQPKAEKAREAQRIP